MGKVKYATGIDYVQGSLAKPKVKEGHTCGTYLIGTHRTAATTNPNCITAPLQPPIRIARVFMYARQIRTSVRLSRPARSLPLALASPLYPRQSRPVKRT